MALYRWTMRRWMARRADTGAARALLLLFPLLWLTSGCAGASATPEELPIPTFAPSAADPSPGASGAPDGRLPAACDRLLSAGDLGALFAMPLGSVSVHTIRGVPEPSVGRVERLTCSYTTGGGSMALLELNIGRYADAASASDHWKLNSAAERAGEGSSRDVPIGSAPAVLVEHRGETVLLVAYGVDTLTFVLPGDAAGGRLAADALVDLALRVLRPIAATAPTTAPVVASVARIPAGAVTRAGPSETPTVQLAR